MKVAYIAPDLHLEGGGVRTFLQMLFRCIASDRVEKIVIVETSSDADRQHFEALGVKVISRTLNSRFDRGTSLESLRWLIHILKRESPDVVHTHLYWGDTLGREAAYRAGVPIILATEHNMNLNEGPQHRRTKRRLAQITDRVICVSNAVRRYSCDIDKIPEGRLSVIHYGLLLDEFKCTLATHETTQRFLWIGRLEKQKNPFLLIDAFSAFAKAQPDCQLTIIGDGSLSAQCKERVMRLDLSDRVQFLGFKPQPWDYAQAGSVFVLASAFEGLCIAVLEAMAAGHLCVLPDIEPCLEAAVEGKSAIFYRAGNVAALLQAMRRASKLSEATKAELISNARSEVTSRFDAYTMAAKYLSVYQELYAKCAPQTEARDERL